MKKLSSFFVVSLLATIVFAQPQAPDTLWTRTFGGLYEDQGKRVLQTSDGGYAILGNSGGDVYLLKTDSIGNEEWERCYGGAGTQYSQGFTVADDGGFVIVGQTNVSLNYNIYLLKTDSSGNLLWERQISSIEDNCSGWDIDLTVDGGFIICGWCYWDTSAFDYTDGFLLKTDGSGNVLWSRTYGSTYDDWLISLHQCQDGGFISTGYKSINSTWYDAYLIKTDSLGNLEWERTFGGDYGDLAYDVELEEDGGFVLVGAYGLTNSNTDIYLIKTDNFGIEQWHSIIGSYAGNEGGFCVQKTLDYGYVIIGTTDSFLSTVPLGDTDVYLIKTDSSGILEWQIALGNSGYDYGAEIQLTSDSGFIIVGTTQTNSYNIYLIKMGPENLDSHISLSFTPQNPPVQIPAGGGSFQYNLSIINDGLTQIPFDFWIEIDPPNKGISMFRLQSNLNLLPGDSLYQTISQSIPANAPTGTYNFMAFVGENPCVVLDSASFNFVKLGGRMDIVGIRDEGFTGWDYEVINGVSSPVPTKFALYPPSPNPFNSTVTLSFELSNASPVELTIYDICGKKVATLDTRHSTLGKNCIEWDASEQASGIYFVRMQTGDFSQTRKMVLLK
jgi:hypothetical protein